MFFGFSGRHGANMSLFLFFASAIGAIMFGLLDFLIQTS